MPQPMSDLPENEALNKPSQGMDVDLDLEEVDPSAITMNEDGSADVDFGEEGEEPAESEEFTENLADNFLDEQTLSDLGSMYMDYIEIDIETRKKRDKQYAEGIKRTGLGGEAPGGADFDGSSKVVHPMLAQGCIDFASRAIKELMPATGPCKTQIIGEQNDEKVDRAERKKTYMNWQVTTQIEEYRAELERLLSQVPLAGAQYKRWWWDQEQMRPRTEAIYLDDVFMPYGHADFYTCPRISYRERIGPEEFDRRTRTGVYRDINVGSAGLSMSDDSASRKATDAVEGATDNGGIYDQDGLRTVWTVEVNTDCTQDSVSDDRVVPYILHLDDSSGKVLGMFRNWKETDDRFRKKHWVTEWAFIPWRGGPALGLTHIIGSLSAAATGAMRALLDSAHIANFPGAVKLKGGRTAGQSVSVNATEIAELDAPAGVDDIRKLVMAFPFAGPSPVLIQMLELLGQQAQAVVSVASEKIAEGGADMPMGTALALIEHGSANFSAIHARLHASMKRDLAILHRLNGDFMDDEDTVEDLGDLVVHRADFQGPMDIIPVSDPNIFSEAQRYAQIQAIQQLRADPQMAALFKPERLLMRALKLMNVSDIEDITNLPKDEARLNPTDENYTLAKGDRPLKVYEEQDDLHHLMVHVHFATSPMFGANMLIAPSFIPPMLDHCKDHLLALYRKHTKAASQTIMEVVRAQTGETPKQSDCDQKGQALVDQQLATLLSPMVMPALQAMQQQAQQISQMGAPQADPSIALQEQTKTALKKMELDAAQAKYTIEAQSDAADRDSTEKLAKLATTIDLMKDEQNHSAAQLRDQFKAQTDKQMVVLTQMLAGFVAQLTASATAATESAAAATEAVATTAADKAAGKVAAAAKPTTSTQVIMPNGMDLSQIMAPLTGSLQQTLSDALTSMDVSQGPLADALAALQSQQSNFKDILAGESETNRTAFASLAQGLQTLAQSSAQGHEAEIYIGPDGKKRARRVPAQPQQPQGQLPPPQQPQPQPEGQPQ